MPTSGRIYRRRGKSRQINLAHEFDSTHPARIRRESSEPPRAALDLAVALGHKAESVASLPPAYRDQLARYRPELRDWIGAE